jgi:hypothetical protein
MARSTTRYVHGVRPRLQPGTYPQVRGISLGALYLIVGIVVAAVNDYFDNLGTLRRVGEALIAIIIWPLVLFGVDINLR